MTKKIDVRQRLEKLRRLISTRAVEIETVLHEMDSTRQLEEFFKYSREHLELELLNLQSLAANVEELDLELWSEEIEHHAVMVNIT